MKRKIKLILAPLIVTATVIGFSLYAYNNPQVIDKLFETSPYTITGLVLLYGGWTIALMGILFGSLAMYSKRVDAQENFYITAYSSIVNFFGPGQSGPAVRAAYLKLKHGVSVRQYAFATLIYYGFYSLISGAIIAIAALPWWLSSILIILATTACLSVIVILRRRKSPQTRGAAAPLVIIAAFALLQVAIQACIYFVELQSIGSNASIAQTLVYTGTANFALFVALTPGAIGFREAFLLFTQRIHGISNDAIVAANVLDRAAYILFLGTLFVIIIGLRTRSRFARLQNSLTPK